LTVLDQKSLTAPTESSRSNREILRYTTGGNRPILLKNSVSQQHENSSEFFNRLVRASQINCAVLSRVRLDFHATSATPSYIQYAMPLISKQSFSTE
jgi:hypothetical protein